MKKLVVIIIAIMAFLPLRGQTIVMEEDGGVYKIPCLVNGAKMKFIFDTGASAVSLSLPMAEYLLDNDYISKSDFIKAGQSVIADGSIVDHMEINLRDIEISGKHLLNVPAIVIASQNAPLLLGLSAIQKLGRIEINGNVLTIVNGNTSDKDDRVNELFDKIDAYARDGLYSKEKECWKEVYALTELSDYGLFKYACCCWFSGDKQEALKLIDEIEDYDNIDAGYNYYDTIGNIYYVNRRYPEAISFFKKAASVDKKAGDMKSFGKSLTDLGYAYFYSDDYERAWKSFAVALKFLYEEEGGVISDIHHDEFGELGKSHRTKDIDEVEKTEYADPPGSLKNLTETRRMRRITTLDCQ